MTRQPEKPRRAACTRRSERGLISGETQNDAKVRKAPLYGVGDGIKVLERQMLMVDGKFSIKTSLVLRVGEEIQ